MILRKLAGFTLIETIIYIALLSLILSGSLVITHQIFDNSRQTNQKIVAQAEAAFDEKFGRDLRESGTALMNRRFYGSFTPMRDRDTSLQHVASEFAEQIVAKLNTMPGEARAKWIADLFVEMGKLRD